MPVWPFTSRSIRHRTFGKLKSVRNGNYWRGRLPIPHATGAVEVHISGGHAGPTDAQERLFLALSDRYRDVHRDALAAVHGEYQRVRQVQPGFGWPPAGQVSDVEALAPLDRIWLDDADWKQFVLSFNHAKDKEHSFHVFFKDGKLKSVSSER